MTHSSLVMFGREEYEQILRSVIIADYLRSRNGGRDGRSADGVSPLQRRLFDEAERFGMRWEEGEQDRFAEQCLREVDDFAEGEAWEELAWWIAEREFGRRAPGSRDADARDLITHRYYHEVMEEFRHHGINRVEIAGLRFSPVSPEEVRMALAQFKKEARKNIG